MTTDTTSGNKMLTLTSYVQRATVVYRKGEVVTERNHPGLKVITIDAFPALPEGEKTTVDCHFIRVGFTEALAELSHREFYELVLANELGFFTVMDQAAWERGPSYLTVGGWIGDQTLAFQAMACIQAHGLGRVITPASMGITDPAQADQLAGQGMVMITGLKAPEQAP